MIRIGPTIQRRPPNVFACVLLLLFFATVSSGHLSPAYAQGTGSLSVTTTPVRAAIYVDNVFKGTSFWSGNLDPGPHMVSFGDVEGYIAPAPQIVNITAGQTSYAIGAYRKLLSAGQREWSRVRLRENPSTKYSVLSG